MATLATLGQTKLGHHGHHPEGVAKLVAGHALFARAVSLGPAAPAPRSRRCGAHARDFGRRSGRADFITRSVDCTGGASNFSAAHFLRPPPFLPTAHGG